MAARVTDGDPGAFAGERPDADPGAIAGVGEVGRVVTQPQPDEVSLGGRDRPALARQLGGDPVPLGDDRLDPIEQLGLGGQRRDRGRLGQRVHGEGQHRLADRSGHRLVPDQEADPQSRQPVSLGEGPHHRHVGPVPVQRQPVRHVAVTDVLRIRLVQDDQAVSRHPVQEVRQLAAVHNRPGGVIRVAHEDQPGPAGDRGRHRSQVVRLVAQRHPYRGDSRKV